MANYHITGIFVLEHPADATTEVFTSALNGQVGLDTAVVVTPDTVEQAVLDNLDRLMARHGLEPHHIVRDHQSALADQLTDVVAASQETARTTDAQSWMWFLTDDTVVTDTTLANQLKAVEISPSVAIAGAKQLSDRRLLNVGLTVAHNGDVLSMIEPGELDQGQYDHRTDTFAVSLPGMLVKSDVWDALGGFDPLTPNLVGTVDLCWRARLAGHRVAVVAAAQVQHDTPPAEPAVSDAWAAARWLRLKHTGFFAMLGGWLWGFFAALGLVIAGLFVKDPATGAAQAGGVMRTLTRPLALQRSRKTAAATRTRPHDTVDELRPSRARVRDYRRSVLEVSEPDRVIGDGTGSSLTPQQATGGHDDFEEMATPDRNWVGIGAVTLVVLFGAVTLLGLRHLIGVPALAGGNLLPVSNDLAAIVHKAASGWAQAGAGAAGYDGPFGWLLALFGLTTNASMTLVWLWILALPLAGLGAWVLTGAITSSRYLRFAAGIVWAGAPVLLVSLTEGRLGGLVTHLVLPWLVLALLRAIGYKADDIELFRSLTHDRTDDDSLGQRPVLFGRKARDARSTTSLTAAAWLAILLTVITAVAPSMFLPLTAGLIVVMLVLRSTAKVLWWTPLLAATTLLPAVITHGTDLRAIFADPGAPAGYDPAPTWQLLLGLPHNTALDAGLAELPWLDFANASLPWAGIFVGIIAIPVLVAAIIGAIAPGVGGNLARAGVLTGFIGLAVATANSGFIFAVDQTGVPVALSTTPAVSLAWAGWLIAAIIGVNYLTVGTSQRRTGLATVRLRAGWPARTVTTALVVTGVVSTGLWLTPRMVPNEALTQARSDALSERTVADALASTDAEPVPAAEPDDSGDLESSRASLAQPTGTSSVTGVQQHALPATAIDSALSELQTRTLVITRTSEGIRTHLVSGAGTMLDDMTGTWTSRSVAGGLFNPESAGSDDADNALRTVAAQLTAGADADPRPTLDALGAGYVVLTDPSGTETSLAAGIDAAPGMAPVGHSNAGWLWRVLPEDVESDDEDATQAGVDVLTEDGVTEPRGTATARARITQDDQTVAIAASNADGSIDVELPEADAPRELVIAERANPGFRAYLDGEELEATASNPEWVQSFALPETGGNLTMNYAPAAGKWLWWIPGILALITLLLGIPTRARRTTRRVND
ncbi:hypothetical protein GCM10009720_00840 [Yaniella flava]|uniref:Glycosyl transferase n=1 Tax=Yaniella flava TaxID=287930 RepID=A0ABN2TYM6_9MICC